jgi:hypothetical protein
MKVKRQKLKGERVKDKVKCKKVINSRIIDFSMSLQLLTNCMLTLAQGLLHYRKQKVLIVNRVA